MKGVPSIVKNKQQKPSDDVRNLFDKKTYNMAKENPYQSLPSLPQQHKLFEYEGKYEQESEYKFSDENISNAIELRQQRQRHTDFFFKLHDLKERIVVYNTVFRSKKPKFIHHDPLKKKATQIQTQQNNEENVGSEKTPGSKTTKKSRKSFNFSKGIEKSISQNRDSLKRKSTQSKMSQKIFQNIQNPQKRKTSDLGSIFNKQQEIKEDNEDDKESISSQGKEENQNEKQQENKESTNQQEAKPQSTFEQKQDIKEKKISEQNIRSIENVDSQEQREKFNKTQRIQAIESNLPSLRSQTQFNTLLKNNKNIKNHSQEKNLNKSQSEAKFQSKLPQSIPSQRQQKYLKNDNLNNNKKQQLQSFSQVNFKHIKLKKKNKDKTTSIKSVYESNLQKELSPIKQKHKLQQNGNKKTKKSPSPSPSPNLTINVNTSNIKIFDSNEQPSTQKYYSNSLNQSMNAERLKQISQVYLIDKKNQEKAKKKQGRKGKKKKDQNNEQVKINENKNYNSNQNEQNDNAQKENQEKVQSD